MDNDLEGKFCILESKLSWDGLGSLYSTASNVLTPQTFRNVLTPQTFGPFGTSAADHSLAWLPRRHPTALIRGSSSRSRRLFPNEIR